MDNILRITEELDLAAAHVVENRVVAQCPFREHEHDFERPGFSIFMDTGHWICFKGCGQGDLIGLVSSSKGITPFEAKTWIRKYIHPNITDVLDRLKAKVYDRESEKTPNYYQQDYEQQDATKTSQYILDRGFTPSTLVKFGVRLDPVLRCLVIPIRDITGEIVGIVRREVPGYELPTRTKYFYSPGFNVADNLFGIDHHRPRGTSILVEGSLDVMRLHQYGYTNAVGLLGSFCSSSQRKLLAKLGHTVYVGLDNDEAGRTAAKRTIKDLSGQFVVKVIKWPENDPGECTQEQVDEAMEVAYVSFTGITKY